MKYIVVKTPCYPNVWKVKGERPLKDENGISNYFPSLELAQREADRRNEALKAEAVAFCTGRFAG